MPKFHKGRAKKSLTFLILFTFFADILVFPVPLFGADEETKSAGPAANLTGEVGGEGFSAGNPDGDLGVSGPTDQVVSKNQTPVSSLSTNDQPLTNNKGTEAIAEYQSRRFESAAGVTPEELITGLVDRVESEVLDPGLPPLMDGFIVLLLSVLRINTPDGGAELELNNRFATVDQKMDIGKRANFLLQGIRTLLHLYENPPKYDANSMGKIDSVYLYKLLTEPTLGDGYRLFEDLATLASFIDELDEDTDTRPTDWPFDIPIPDEDDDTGAFSSSFVRDEVREFKNRRAERLTRLSTRLFGAVMGTGGGSLLDGFYVVLRKHLFNSPTQVPGNLRAVASLIRNPPKFAKSEAVRKLMDESTDAAALLDNLADVADDLGDLVSRENLAAALRSIVNGGTKGAKGLIQGCEGALNDAIPSLYDISQNHMIRGAVETLRRSGQHRFAQALEVLFIHYPKQLPPVIIKQIFLDLIRADRLDDLDVVAIMIQNFDPIIKNIFQHEANHKELGLIRTLFQRLQHSGSKPAPFRIIREILQETEGKYNFDAGSFSAMPIGVGKLAQVHRATVDGKPVAVRFLLPDSERYVNWGIEALTNISSELGPVLFPEVKDPELAKMMTQQVLELKSENSRQEMDFARTVRMQNLAVKKLGCDEEVEFVGLGKVRVRVEVPHAYEQVEPGDRLMVYDWVEGMRTSEFIRDRQGPPNYGKADTVVSDPLIRGLADYLTRTVYKGAIFTPLQQSSFARWLRRRRRNQEGGVLNTDPHPGNFFWNFTPGPVPEVVIYMMDWGLSAEIEIKDVNQILILAYGAEFNEAVIIADALMKLSKSDDTQHRGLKGFKNSIPGVGDSEKTKTYDRAYAEVLRVTKGLEGGRILGRPSWRSAEWWIEHMWKHGFLDFPAYLVGLYDASDGMLKLRKELGLRGPENTAGVKEFFASHRFPVFRRAWHNYPIRALASFRRKPRYLVNQCITALSGVHRAPFDPNEGLEP